jgi:signal transduction histidine kinase
VLDFGLEAAVEWLADESARRHGVPVSTQLSLPLRPLPPELGIGVFRVLQEALNNAGRHAAAKRVEVQLSATPDELVLEVSDDGRGFDPRRARTWRTFALIGMRERALAMGGSLRVHSQPGTGTRVVLRLPLPPVAAAPFTPPTHTDRG